MHRALYRIAHRSRLLVWRVRRMSVQGVRVLALDGQGRVLLVRHSYGSGTWMLPSGGLRRGEDPLEAAARELAEETGCVLANARLVLVIEEGLRGATNRVHVITGTAQGIPRADGREIVDTAFFALDALPEPISERVLERLEAWITLAATVPPEDRG